MQVPIPSREKNVSSNSLTYVGHATVEIELDGAHLITDPVLRNRVVHLKRQVPAPENPHGRVPDAILLSHQHFDHLDLPSLRGFGSGVRIICAPGTGGLLQRKGFTRVEELGVGESSTVGAVTVTAVPARHDGRRRPGSRPGQAIGFVIQGSRQIYFAGDTDLFQGMDRISTAIDVALIPVWGWGHTLGEGHLDPDRAAEAVGLIRPKLTIPIHWGTLFPMMAGRFGRKHLTQPPQRFADQVALDSPGTEVRVLAPGATTELG
ncbi:MAG: MBL fold metallo-hydrolase [Actinomycetota bacterium]|nr:MBL fold metallo-hydrolase [Actinomycetota bacterium]